MQKKIVSISSEEKQLYWRSLFEDTFDFVHIYDKQENLLYVNKACRNSLGLSTHIAQRPCRMDTFIIAASQEDFHSRFQHALKTGESGTFNMSFSSQGGRKVSVKAQFSLVHSPLYETAIIKGIFRDNTNEVKALKAQTLYFNLLNYNMRLRLLPVLYQKIFQQLNHFFDVPYFAVLSYAAASPTAPTFTCFTHAPQSVKAETSQKIISTLLAKEVMDRGNAILVYKHRIQKLLQQHGHAITEPLPTVWGGIEVPHQGAGEAIVLCFYTCQFETEYNHTDLDILEFIARQVSMVIERSNKQKQMEQNDAKMLAIIESSTHQIWVVDKHYALISFNSNFARCIADYFGTSPKKGDSVLSSAIVSASTGAESFWKKKYEEAFTGQAINFQICLYTQAGKEVWRDVFISPILPSAGQVVELSVMAHDITHKKLAIQELKESEEKFRNIFESFQDIYFRFTPNGTLTMISPSVEEITGYKAANFVGKNIHSFLRMLPQQKDIFKVLREKKSLHNIEMVVYKKKDRSPVICLCSMRIHQKSDTQDEFLEGVARDISLRKKTDVERVRAKEAAEQALDAKRTFLANMSHEIRTPVNGIVGTLALLEGTSPFTDEQQTYMQLIQKSSETLLYIIEDILNLSKIEAGKAALYLHPIIVRKTFEKLLNLFQQQARAQDVTLELHIDPELPDCLELDEVRFLQVLSNLTSNAIKFSHPHTTAHIYVDVQRVNKKGQCTFRVKIQDTGIGIRRADKSLLFQTFGQIERNINKKFAGTGLGLAISKQLIKQMGGRIGVTSSYRKGSTFWFSLRANKMLPVIKKEKKNTPKRADIRDLAAKVLLVDDNKINAMICNKLLTQAGAQVVVASNGEQALSYAKKQSFDIILMDIQMPEKDGVQVTAEMRATIPNLPPIVAVTAYAMAEDRVRFLAQGLDYYLSKPILPKVLVEKVTNWVQAYRHDKVDMHCVDMATLQALGVYLSKQKIADVLQEFEQETATLLKQAYAAIEREDYSLLSQQMHTLKGSAGTAGVALLPHMASILESKLNKKEYAGIMAQFEQLLLTFSAFRRGYKRVLRTL